MEDRSEPWEISACEGANHQLVDTTAAASDEGQAAKAVRIQNELEERLYMLMKAHVAMLEERNTYQNILLEISAYLQDLLAHQIPQQDRDIRQVRVAAIRALGLNRVIELIVMSNTLNINAIGITKYHY